MSSIEITEILWAIAEKVTPARSSDTFLIENEINEATIRWRYDDQPSQRIEVSRDNGSELFDLTLSLNSAMEKRERYRNMNLIPFDGKEEQTRQELVRKADREVMEIWRRIGEEFAVWIEGLSNNLADKDAGDTLDTTKGLVPYHPHTPKPISNL